MFKPYLHIVFVFSVLFSTEALAMLNNDLKLLTIKTTFVAGNEVVLKFSVNNHVTPFLYVSNSFGSTLIKPNKKAKQLHYKIPEDIAAKMGIINWRLVTASKTLYGQIKIIPKPEVSKIQTYVGPPSIVTGGTDYSMLVAIPTDAYDNPMPDNTKVAINYHFQNSQQVDTVFINNSISYRNLYSSTKTGRIFVSSSCLNFNSKEFDINVMPSAPTNFSINAKRHHEFADGNQITTFSTSTIKDRYKNVVSDGTYVTFFIKTRSGTILKTSGTTINGMATAKMVHPDKADTWSVRAFVEGMAESNTIKIPYKAVISSVEIKFSNNNRSITVGPFKSFMNQKIPDGLAVALAVYKEDLLIQTLRKHTANGYVHFKLNTNVCPSGTYNFKCTVARITRQFPNIKL